MLNIFCRGQSARSIFGGLELSGKVHLFCKKNGKNNPDSDDVFGQKEDRGKAHMNIYFYGAKHT